MKHCYIDTETTGLNPAKHEIIEIAIITILSDVDSTVSALGSRGPTVDYGRAGRTTSPAGPPCAASSCCATCAAPVDNRSRVRWVDQAQVSHWLRCHATEATAAQRKISRCAPIVDAHGCCFVIPASGRQKKQKG